MLRSQKPSTTARPTAEAPDADAAASGEGFSPALTRAFKERLRPCLNALDGLRSQGLQKEISLPAIAVVGDQSVGKSSVLEAISGVEFPRGLGIVTRCPLMLSMRGRDDSGWAARIRYETKSGEARDKPLSTPAAIGQAIREAQEEMTSSAGEISDKLIELHIEGADTPDLTLIDLPGIARFSISGGGDVATMSKSLIMSFIEKPEVLIMVVIPCNVDVETVEAVSLAREVDPDSKRTIGVLTCPDLVNPGAEQEVLAMMRNERVKLLKGFVTVRCRTPQQLKDNVSLQLACQAEEEFFRTHPQFQVLDEYQRGSKTLANKLSVELYEAVKARVPEILMEIQTKREEYHQQLESLGVGPPESDEEMKDLLVTMTEEFKKEFENSAEGTYRHEKSRLYGDCRQHWEELADAIESCAFSESTDSKSLLQALRQDVAKQRGSELLGFDNIYPVLQRLVRSHFLVQLRPYATQFLLSVTQQVDTTLRDLSDRVFGKFPSLNRHVKQEADGIKSAMLEASRKHIEEIFEQEGFVFSQDRIFGKELQHPTVEQLQSKKPADEAATEATGSAEARAANPDQVLDQNSRRVLVGAEAYMRVAVRRLQDNLPMAVIHHMLHRMSTKVAHRLGIMLTDIGSIGPMLQEEDPDVSLRRRHLKQLMESLGEAERQLAAF